MSVAKEMTQLLDEVRIATSNERNTELMARLSKLSKWMKSAEDKVSDAYMEAYPATSITNFGKIAANLRQAKKELVKLDIKGINREIDAIIADVEKKKR